MISPHRRRALGQTLIMGDRCPQERSVSVIATFYWIFKISGAQSCHSIHVRSELYSAMLA
jgi:hypothetical protein